MARDARGRREGDLALPFERHAAYQLIFLYGAYIVAVQLSVTDWPGKIEILEKIVSRLLPTG